MPYPAVDLYPSNARFPGFGDVPPSVDGAGVVLNGMSLSGFDSFGVEWRTFAPITGWDGSTGSTINVQQKTRADGGWPGTRNRTPRHISPNGLMLAPDADSAVAALDRLNTAATLGGSVFTVTRGMTARSAIVYRLGEVDQSEINDVTFQWGLDLIAPDPRKFATAFTSTTRLPFTTGGLTIPFTIPFAITATTASGGCSLTNPGNDVGPVKIRIDGPVTGPIVTHLGSGAALEFATTLSLNAGEWLDVDMEAQTAFANGTASRGNYIVYGPSTGWPGFEPGLNQWAFAAASTDPGALLTVTATPAWQ